MKKLAILVMAFLLILSFAACGGDKDGGPKNDPPQTEDKVPEKGEYLYKALGNELLAGIDENKPVSITVGIDHMGAVEEAVFEGDDLDAALEAFKQIKIGDETQEMVTDNYNYIVLEWADGTQVGISLNLYNLETTVDGEYRIFELENLSSLWSMAESSAVPADMGGAAHAGAGE